MSRIARKKQLRRTAFTLVELLVVIAVIALLVSMLLPSLGKAKDLARRVVCLSNLRSIGTATYLYVAANNDRFPDPYTMGGGGFYETTSGKIKYTGTWGYRQAPGMIDPNGIPEEFGLAGALEDYIPVRDQAWVCPDAGKTMKSYQNTYAYSSNSNLGNYDVSELCTLMDFGVGFALAWDNLIWRPAPTGVRGVRGGTFPRGQERVCHQGVGPEGLKDHQYVSYLWYDGHAAPYFERH